MRSRADAGAPDRIEGLRSTLDAAVHLIEQLAEDAVLARLLDAYHAMPLADREVVVGAIERDVQASVLSRATEDITGQGTRPNPNARLYIRAHGTQAQRSDLERDEMMLATLRAIRVMRLLLVPEIHAEWREATRAAFDQVDAETRVVVGRLIAEVLELLAASDRAARES